MRRRDWIKTDRIHIVASDAACVRVTSRLLQCPWMRRSRVLASRSFKALPGFVDSRFLSESHERNIKFHPVYPVLADVFLYSFFVV